MSWVLGVRIKLILITVGAVILTRIARVLIRRTSRKIRMATEEHGSVVVGERVQGIQELGEDVVMIRVIVWVTVGDRRAFERVPRLRLKEALDEARIEMPNRQLDVWLRRGSRAA